MHELGSADLATGVREIDADMESLCFLLARIFEPLVECRRRFGDCDHTRCSRIGAISTFIERSFARQEGLMGLAEYPLADDHLADHEALRTQLTAMLDANVCADRDAQVVQEAMLRWLTRHNRTCDRQLANWAVTRRLLSPES